MVRPRQHGLTLLEVLAALLILAVAIFAMMQLQGQALWNTITTRRLARAEAAAETAMDAFLATPIFNASGDVIEGPADVDLEGYAEGEFDIKVVLTEHVPLDEQTSLYVNPADEEAAVEAARDKLPEDSDDEPVPFDPGTFIGVTVEVWDARPPNGLLATLETWIPKPLTEEEKLERAERAGSDGSTLGTGGTGGGTGGSTGGSSGGRTGDGTRGGRPSGTGGPSGTGNLSGDGGAGGGGTDRPAGGGGRSGPSPGGRTP